MLALQGKRLVVVGLGVSGIAAALSAAARGAVVIALDTADVVSDAVRASLAAGGVQLRLGEKMRDQAYVLPQADIFVVSPGVPSFFALEEKRRAGTPVLSELELGWQLRGEPLPAIAVGGTNGKSTVTTLLGAFCSELYPRLFLGGNLGEPLCSVAEKPLDGAVIEVSSFQLEHPEAFHPRVSLLLNVTDDHLDRYESFSAYAKAKGNAFLLQDAHDLAVIPSEDTVCLAQATRGKGRIVTFGRAPNADVFVQSATQTEPLSIVDRRDGEVYSAQDILLRGEHNMLNVAAAIAAARDLGVAVAHIRKVLKTFQGLPHRMAWVRTVAGVHYYDDSKGTNVGASVTAVLGMQEPKVVLLCGGKDKGGSYEPLVSALRQKGRGAVLIGEAAPLIWKALAELGPDFPVREAKTMEEAVLSASVLAQQGDAVLLSPACASFDMFRDYKHRGDVFVESVKALAPIETGAANQSEVSG
jgi:UDP-N-acetylmuramoylalanine--D-glutamate ligase